MANIFFVKFCCHLSIYLEAYYSVTRSGPSAFPMVWWQVQFIHWYPLYVVEVIKFERILHFWVGNWAVNCSVRKQKWNSLFNPVLSSTVISRWKHRFSSDHRSWATSSPVSTWMGDRLGIPGAVGFSLLRHIYSPNGWPPGNTGCCRLFTTPTYFVSRHDLRPT